MGTSSSYIRKMKWRLLKEWLKWKGVCIGITVAKYRCPVVSKGDIPQMDMETMIKGNPKKRLKNFPWCKLVICLYFSLPGDVPQSPLLLAD